MILISLMIPRDKCIILSREEEQYLIHQYQLKKTETISNKLLLSHYKMIIHTAMKFQKYKIPLDDLIQEGCIGFYIALNKFSPEKNVKLSTYSLYWIKAKIILYIYKNYFVCNLNRSPANQLLFFKLKRLKNQYIPLESNSLAQDEIFESISKELNIDKEKIICINNLLDNHHPVSENIAMQHSIELSPEEKIINKDKLKKCLNKINELKLSKPEKTILNERLLTESNHSFKEIGKKLNLTGERIRQINNNLIEKLKKNEIKELLLS